MFNAVLGLRQEGKAAAAVAALQKMMIIKARVTRDGQLAQLPAEQLVPGDIVAVEAGDIVPADGRLLRAATLEVAESALTGESLPVVEGHGPGRAGRHPARGSQRHGLHEHQRHPRLRSLRCRRDRDGHRGRPHLGDAPVHEGVEDPPHPSARHPDAADLPHRGPGPAGVGGHQPRAWREFTAIFPAAVAFAIGALPENMPAVVTTILAYGTQALAKAGAIMKRLQSTETLGSTSAINSDKTGTLTLNEMTAVQMALVGRRYSIEGTGYSSEGRITRVAGLPEVPLDPFLLPMVLASDAVLDGGALIGDPTEGALVALAAKGGVDAVATRRAYPRVAELPFDAAYKLMATFHEMTDESGARVVRCFVKGAPDQLLARASTVHDADAGPLPADGAVKERYLAENARLGERGPARAGHGTQGLRRRRASTPPPTCFRSWRRPRAAVARGDRRPSAAHGKGVDREGHGRRHPGAHDHRRPRRDGGGDRARAGHRGRGDDRGASSPAWTMTQSLPRSTMSGSSPGSRPRTRSGSSTCSSDRDTSSP